MEIRYEIKSYLFCFIFESAMVRSEMEVVLRCENDVLVDTLTVVDFTMLYVVWLAFHGWCHEPVVIIVSCFIGGYNQYITDHNRLVTPRVKNASQTTQNIFQFSSVQFSLFSQNKLRYKNTHKNCKLAREPRKIQKAYESWAPQSQRNK